jgi:hypothetical protein
MWIHLHLSFVFGSISPKATVIPTLPSPVWVTTVDSFFTLPKLTFPTYSVLYWHSLEYQFYFVIHLFRNNHECARCLNGLLKVFFKLLVNQTLGDQYCVFLNVPSIYTPVVCELLESRVLGHKWCSANTVLCISSLWVSAYLYALNKNDLIRRLWNGDIQRGKAVSRHISVQMLLLHTLPSHHRIGIWYFNFCCCWTALAAQVLDECEDSVLGRHGTTPCKPKTLCNQRPVYVRVYCVVLQIRLHALCWLHIVMLYDN